MRLIRKRKRIIVRQPGKTNYFYTILLSDITNNERVFVRKIPERKMTFSVGSQIIRLARILQLKFVYLEARY